MMKNLFGLFLVLLCSCSDISKPESVETTNSVVNNAPSSNANSKNQSCVGEECVGSRSFIGPEKHVQSMKFGRSVDLNRGLLAVGSTDRNGAVHLYRRADESWEFETKLTASNGHPSSRFGHVVAVDGDIVVVGAEKERGCSTDVEDEYDCASTGAAYVFERSADGWIQTGYLKNVDGERDDFFGGAVAIHNGVVVVGAHAHGGRIEGAVFVFEKRNGTWIQTGFVKPESLTSLFGSAISIQDDLLAVGTSTESGCGVGIGGDPDDQQCFESGAVYLYRRSGDAWVVEAYLKSSNSDSGDGFGTSVSLSGNRLAVGAIHEASCSNDINSGMNDNECSDDGGTAFNDGAVYIFTEDSGSWSESAYIKASDSRTQRLGSRIALEGDYLLAGAPGDGTCEPGIYGESEFRCPHSGAAFLFAFDNGWRELAKFKTETPQERQYFGAFVAMDDVSLAITANGLATCSEGIADAPTYDEECGFGGGVFTWPLR